MKSHRRSRNSKKTIGNSPTFYRRLRKLSPGKRVSKKFEGENPAHHSDLFTDENPKGTVHGLKFKNKIEAKLSVKKLEQLLKHKKITYAHASQITNTMIQRAKYHAHPTLDIKEGQHVWQDFKIKKLINYHS
jgi:hypothetical protein